MITVVVTVCIALNVINIVVVSAVGEGVGGVG